MQIILEENKAIKSAFKEVRDQCPSSTWFILIK